METQELELQHLAPYLPYGLKILLEISIEVSDYFELKTDNLEGVLEYQRKPILRPLSDLVKEIEHNGEKFVPILELAKVSDSFYEWKVDKTSLFHKSAVCYRDKDRFSFSVNTDLKKIYSFNTTLNGSFIQTNNPHLVYEKLFELHFDVFGLIEKGLAVDSNTVNQ